MSALAIYHLSRKVIARQMAKITWLRSQLYERSSENGREYLCVGRVRPIQRGQVAQVIGNDFAVPMKGAHQFLCGPKPMSGFFLLLSLAKVLVRMASEYSCYRARAVRFDRGSGVPSCSPRHSAPGPCRAPALHGSRIWHLERHVILRMERSRPQEEPASLLPAPGESLNCDPSLYVMTLLLERKGILRLSTILESNSLRKSAASLRRPAESL
jgi:hypothetical protein